MGEGELAEPESSPDSSPGACGSSSALPQSLLTIHRKEKAEIIRTSQHIVDFASACYADALVMGSVGGNQASASFQRTTLGSSAHLAALRAPCTVMIIRPGCRVEPR